MSNYSSESLTPSGRRAQVDLISTDDYDRIEENVVDVNDSGESPSTSTSCSSPLFSRPGSTSTATSTSLEPALLPNSPPLPAISVLTRPSPLPRSFISTIRTLSGDDLSLPEIRALLSISRFSDAFPFCESPSSLSRPSTSEGLRPAPLFHSRQAANVPITTSQEDSPHLPDSTDRDLKAEADFQHFIDWKTTQWRSDLYPLQALDIQQTYRTPDTYSRSYRFSALTSDDAPSPRPYFEWLPRAPSELDPRDPFTIATNAAAEFQRRAFWQWKKAQWHRKDNSEHVESRAASHQSAVNADKKQIFKEYPDSWPTRRASHTGEDATDMEVKWQLIRKAFWDHRRQLWAEQERKVKSEEGYDRSRHWWPARTDGKVQTEDVCPTRARGRTEDENILTGGGREGVHVFHAVRRELEGVKDLAGPNEVQRKVFWAGKREEWVKAERADRNEDGFVVVGEKGSEEEQEMFRKVRERGFRLWKEKPDIDDNDADYLVGKGKMRRRYAGGLVYRPDGPRRWDGRQR